MRGRARDETHRAATPLELFFDLSFVVAVALAASNLHHELAEDHVRDGLVDFAAVFFGIWWAWMNFTWFASAYDTDDVPYRLMTMVQITGALIFAAGVPRAFEHDDYTIATLGYVVMRLALVGQWLRAAHGDPDGGATERRYALGVTLVQAAWVARLTLPGDVAGAAFATLIVAELLVPVWAEQAAPTSWHREHITERYGLFTIIVLGESILAATIALQAAAEDEAAKASLMSIAGGGLLIVFSMWWLYFERGEHDVLTSNGAAFVWGYGHYFIFAAAAAVGAGIEVFADYDTGHTTLSRQAAALTVAVPIAIYLLGVWSLHLQRHDRGLSVWALPAGAALMLVAAFVPQPVPVIGVLLAGLTAVVVATERDVEHEGLEG
jgi:low temperature requirement protein LtrA